MVIDYGEWLYCFALGIVFRSLINEAVTSFANEDEIYTLFIHCRKLLLTKICSNIMKNLLFIS